MQLLGGNWKISNKGNDIYDFKKFNDIFTNSFVPEGEMRITTDIALKGSDKFIIYVWCGKRLRDFHVMDKSDGKEIIDKIKEYALAYQVPYSNILFDNDGVGQFVDGFIPGANEFNNGGTVLPNNESGEKENYNHLKSQCYFHSGDSVSRGEYYIEEYAANKKYDATMTLKERLIWERKAIKRGNVDKDGKLCVIPKAEMKNFLDGQSPDVMDAFMMLEWFYFDVNQSGNNLSVSGSDEYNEYDEDDRMNRYLDYL